MAAWHTIEALDFLLKGIHNPRPVYRGVTMTVLVDDHLVG